MKVMKERKIFDIANYRLEKINKVDKEQNPNQNKKGFKKMIEEGTDVISGDSDLNSGGSVSQKIFTAHKKENAILKMSDFSEDFPERRIDEWRQYKEKLQKIINIIAYISYIIGYFIYKSAIINCEKKSIEECVDKYSANNLNNMLICCIISGSIPADILVLCTFGFAPSYHIFISIIFLFSLYFLDQGYNFYSHGLVHFEIAVISCLTFFIFLTTISKFIQFLYQKVFRLYISMVILFIDLLFLVFFLYFFETSCSYWKKGLDGIKINNKKSKYSCYIKAPSKCYMKIYSNMFDFSKMLNYNCSFNLDFKESKTLFDGNVKKILFPKTNNENYYFKKFNSQRAFGDLVLKNIIMENDDTNPVNNEVYLTKDEKNIKVNMQILKDENLVNERAKNVKKNNNNNLEINNILLIYIDSLSRQHFHRKFSDVTYFLESCSSKKNDYYESFEFFKYHTFQNLKIKNSAQSIFYGSNSLNNNNDKKAIHILTHLKKNGFITAQSANICSKEFISFQNSIDEYNDFYESLTKIEEYDHENIALFCDPNYYEDEIYKKTTNTKGIDSTFRRCLYGKDSFEYVLKYGKLFWETYKDSKKFLRLGFFDGNEKTGEVIKYLDSSLFDFLNSLLKVGNLWKTALFLVSGQGMMKAGLLDSQDFFREQFLGSFFIFMFKKKASQDFLNNIRENQQNFITPYDVYNSLIDICYNFDKENVNKNKVDKGESVFNNINSKERTCDKYVEIKKSECSCVKY